MVVNETRVRVTVARIISAIGHLVHDWWLIRVRIRVSVHARRVGHVVLGIGVVLLRLRSLRLAGLEGLGSGLRCCGRGLLVVIRGCRNSCGFCVVRGDLRHLGGGVVEGLLACKVSSLIGKGTRFGRVGRQLRLACGWACASTGIGRVQQSTSAGEEGLMGVRCRSSVSTAGSRSAPTESTARVLVIVLIGLLRVASSKVVVVRALVLVREGVGGVVRVKSASRRRTETGLLGLGLRWCLGLVLRLVVLVLRELRRSGVVGRLLFHGKSVVTKIACKSCLR